MKLFVLSTLAVMAITSVADQFAGKTTSLTFCSLELIENLAGDVFAARVPSESCSYLSIDVETSKNFNSDEGILVFRSTQNQRGDYPAHVCGKDFMNQELRVHYLHGKPFLYEYRYDSGSRLIAPKECFSLNLKKHEIDTVGGLRGEVEH